MSAQWPEISLNEVCNPKQWPTIPTRDLLPTGYPVYGANGLIGYYKDYNHELETILITCRGATCGSINISEPKSYVTGNAMCLDDLDAKRCDRRFLYHALIRRGLKDTITGSAQPQITRQSLEKVAIPIPPLPEQKRIAAILDKADVIRRKRQQAIKLADDFLRATFLDMFGDPVTNPKGWEVGLLGDYNDMETGFAFKSKQYKRKGVRLCRGANVLPKEIEWTDVMYWDESDHSVAKKYHLDEDDIVLAMDRPWISSGLKVARVTKMDLPSFLVQRVARLRGKNGLTNDYLYHLILHPAFTYHCHPKKTETTVPHISPHDIRSYKVPLPPADRLLKFSSIVKRCKPLLERKKLLLENTITLFNSLAQRAFRGGL